MGFHPVDLFLIDAVGIMDVAAAIRQGQHLAAELDDLLRRMGRHVARARNDGGLAGQILALGGEHVGEEIDRAVTGRLGADQRTAPFQPLAGEHAGEVVGDALVLAEHVADLAPAHADIARRNVDIRADVAVELGHEALAEAHDLAGALALGVEVGTTLAAAHGQAGQCVLEGLLEGEELQHRFGDAGVEADAALVGADRVVVLYAPAALDADITGIIFPADAEGNHAVRLGDAAQDLLGVILLLVLHEFENVLGDFLHRLDEFGLVRVALLHTLHEPVEINVIGNCHDIIPPKNARVCDR